MRNRVGVNESFVVRVLGQKMVNVGGYAVIVLWDAEFLEFVQDSFVNKKILGEADYLGGNQVLDIEFNGKQMKYLSFLADVDNTDELFTGDGELVQFSLKAVKQTVAGSDALLLIHPTETSFKNESGVDLQTVIESVILAIDPAQLPADANTIYLEIV